MAAIVGIHGIAQQVKGSHSLHAVWAPALRDGLERTGAPPPAPENVKIAFYGDEFRRRGTKAVGDPHYSPEDLNDPAELDMLEQLWRESARVDPAVMGPDTATKLRTPQYAQRALNALSRSNFFAGLGERLLIGLVKQVQVYLSDEAVYARVQERIEAAVGPDTRVIIGHSLGSVVAYEAVCAHPDWDVALVTLGCPLGIRNVVFDRLRPPPRDGHGVAPAGIRSWTNVADPGDVVALVKHLQPLFGQIVHDEVVHNGAKAHDVSPYLTAVETGRAIQAGLIG